MNQIFLKFMIEKREGHGEDSEPLFLVRDDLSFCAVGVFDGMGGAGASICKSKYGDDHTKAYVASRIVKDSVNEFFNQMHSVSDINSDKIKSTIKIRLEKEKRDYPSNTSSLRSKLVRDYPTTLAITTVFKNEDGKHIVDSYWAGDSRNYLWTQEGFFQISKDDLDDELDPLENLRNDGVMNNCICADRPFKINQIQIKDVPEKFVVLSASDGAFNYFASPMHFHNVLNEGLQYANDENEFEEYCKLEIGDVTGDDVSLSLLAIGFESFEEFKSILGSQNVEKIEEIKSVQKNPNVSKYTLETLIQSVWDEYKKSYMKYISNDEENSENGKLSDTDCSSVESMSFETRIDENEPLKKVEKEKSENSECEKIYIQQNIDEYHFDFEDNIENHIDKDVIESFFSLLSGIRGRDSCSEISDKITNNKFPDEFKKIIGMFLKIYRNR